MWRLPTSAARGQQMPFVKLKLVKQKLNSSSRFYTFDCVSFSCSYSECICLHLLDKWLHAANRPVDHSVRRGRIHPQVSPCILRCFLKDERWQQWLCLIPLIHKSACVCVIRIGELREVMDGILHEQCDYDPASGESYDFDRFLTIDIGLFFI